MIDCIQNKQINKQTFLNIELLIRLSCSDFTMFDIKTELKSHLYLSIYIKILKKSYSTPTSFPTIIKIIYKEKL